LESDQIGREGNEIDLAALMCELFQFDQLQTWGRLGVANMEEFKVFGKHVRPPNAINPDIQDGSSSSIGSEREKRQT